jgi:hypothetical protein
MIAISYRREDSMPIAGRLYDRLQAKFGKRNVFMDFDSIPPGVDFRERIRHTIERSNLVIAVIGPHWLGEQSDGSRRIDDPTDFVRLEIDYALKGGIPVIPLLVNSTPMPKPEKLPSDIEALAFCNALPLDSGMDFHSHAERLINGICGLIVPEARPRHRSKILVSGSLVVIVAIGIALSVLLRAVNEKRQEPALAGAASNVPTVTEPTQTPSIPAFVPKTNLNAVAVTKPTSDAIQPLDLVEDTALNMTMAKYLDSIRTRSTNQLLALFSKVQPWHFTMYDIDTARKQGSEEYTYKQLERDLSNKKGLYWNFFTDDTHGYSYRLEVLSHPFEAWRKIDGFTFRSPSSTTVNYVRWRKEQDRWVVSEIADTSP